MRRRQFLAGVLGLALASCTRTGPGGQARLRDTYVAGTLERNPVMATFLGAAGSGGLRDNRPAALSEEAAFLRALQTELRAVEPGPDAGLMEASIAFRLRLLGELRHYERAVDAYVAEAWRAVAWQLQDMALRAPGLPQWEALATRLAAVPEFLRVAEANLRRGLADGLRPDVRYVRFDGIDGSLNGAGFLEEAVPALAGPAGLPEALAGRLHAGVQGAAEALRRFAAFLEEAYLPGDGVDRYALGEEEYGWRLRTCLRETRSAEQVRSAAQAEVDALREEIRDLTGGRPAESLARLLQDAPADDGEMLAGYRAAVAAAVAQGRGWFAEVPADYAVEVAALPPMLAGLTDAAQYRPPPPLAPGLRGVFYVPPTGGDLARRMLNCRPSMADTAAHEGFPGHDWHYRCMAAAGVSPLRWLSSAGNADSGAMWDDALAVEGWATYAEDLMATPSEGRPHGLYGPEEYLMERQSQLLRAARVVADGDLHARRRPFDEVVAWLAETVDFRPDAASAADPHARFVLEKARRQAWRYARWPLQAATYTLGKQAILALRDASGLDLREFHRRLLAVGPIPAAYVKEEFLPG